MLREILGIFIIYAGITVLVIVLKKLFSRLRISILGIVLVLQPVAMSTYRRMDPWMVLSIAVVGIFIIFWQASKKKDSPVE